MEETIACIDVGTTKTCTLVAETSEEGHLRIVGVGLSPSRGLRKGVVVNVNEAAQSIATAVEKAERVSGRRIDQAYVGVAGSHISCLNSRGVVAIPHSDGMVTPQDIGRALEAARAIAIPYNREVIHIIPRGYVLDGQDGVRDPVGMRAFRLEVEAHIVTGASASIQNLVNAVQQAGLTVVDLVLEPIASGEAVLTEAEREMGVVLADVGGGTTDVAIFIEGSIWHTVIIATGGIHLTNDIAVGLRTPFTTAEEIKIKYGHSIPASIAPDEVVEITTFGDNGRESVSRRYLAQIIQARTEEILELILKEVKRSGYDGLLPAGVVLCGGTAELAGFKEFGRQVLQLPVRVGVPYGLEGLVDVISSPAYATSVGLLLWGQRYGRDTVHAAREGRRQDTLLEKLINWLRAFLP